MFSCCCSPLHSARGGGEGVVLGAGGWGTGTGVHLRRPPSRSPSRRVCVWPRRRRRCSRGPPPPPADQFRQQCRSRRGYAKGGEPRKGKGEGGGGGRVGVSQWAPTPRPPLAPPPRPTGGGQQPAGETSPSQPSSERHRPVDTPLGGRRQAEIFWAHPDARPPSTYWANRVWGGGRGGEAEIEKEKGWRGDVSAPPPVPRWRDRRLAGN